MQVEPSPKKRRRRKKTAATPPALSPEALRNLPSGRLWAALLDPLFQRWQVPTLTEQERKELQEATNAIAVLYLPFLAQHAPLLSLAMILASIFSGRYAIAREQAKKRRAPEMTAEVKGT